MLFAAEMLRHKVLGFQWHVPAFGEEVGMWLSNNKQAKSAHHKGAVGSWTMVSCLRHFALDPLGLSQNIIVPDGWNQAALNLLCAQIADHS